MNRSRARWYREKIEHAASLLTDKDALESVELFPFWETNTSYSINDRIQYSQTLYKCVQAHTSQDDWTPDITPALWTVVSLDEWPEWVQPTGAHDAYNTGDKVTYKNIHWVCLTDANVYAPDVFGWEQVL